MLGRTPEWNISRVSNVDCYTGDTYDLHSKYKELNVLRAEIIDAATFIEGMLTAVISMALAGHDHKIASRLERIVLNTESFAFHTKWKTLQALLKEKEVLELLLPTNSEASRKELLKSLQKSIEDRNKFAHRFISLDASTMTAKLVDSANPSDKGEEISRETVISILQNMHFVYYKLKDILERSNGVA